VNDPAWFDDWVIAHAARFPGLDWGRAPEQLFEGWRHAFLRHRVNKAEAEAASLRAMESRPFPDGMLAALLAAVREVRGTVQDNGPPLRGPDCPVCEGRGWASIPPCNRYPAGSSIPCECEAGAAAHAACPQLQRLSARPDLRARILRDREEREARGARAMAAEGHDGYGPEEEVQRGFRAVTRGRILRPINHQELQHG
jgi:hypothetical protein